MKRYTVTVGFVADGRRHYLGEARVVAATTEEARERATEALFDERLRASGCAPWTVIAEEAELARATRTNDRGDEG